MLPAIILLSSILHTNHYLRRRSAEVLSVTWELDHSSSVFWHFLSYVSVVFILRKLKNYFSCSGVLFYCHLNQAFPLTICKIGDHHAAAVPISVWEADVIEMIWAPMWIQLWWLWYCNIQIIYFDCGTVHTRYHL